MFLISEAKIFNEKKSDFGVTATIKHQQRLCQILGRADLVAAGGMRIQRYDADYGCGGEWRRGTS